MKLVIVTQAVDRDDPNLGAFYHWFEMLATRADSVVILAGRAGTHNLPHNVTVHTFGGARLGKIGRLWKFWELFSRHFADADAALFHQIPEFALAASPFLIGRRQKASLWYAHGATSWRLRLAERLVHTVFTSSEAGFRLPSKKVIHLGQAINTDLFRPADVSPPTTYHPPLSLRMVTVGRISPIKRYETIIAACALLCNTAKNMPWTLAIVGGPLTQGDRVYRERLLSLAREKGLEGLIRFEGERPYSAVPALLAEYDMFLNASRTGSLDKAVLEAMACGLTVITSNQGYRTILPAEYFLESDAAESFAERIASLAGEKRPNEQLREIVVRDHALCSTIDRMADFLLPSDNLHTRLSLWTKPNTF